MSYFYHILNYPKATVEELCRAIKEFGQVDIIVGTGLSGTLPLVAVSIKSEIPIAVIRKPGETNHCCDNIEMSNIDIGIRSYVIIDDFIDTGETIETIINKMSGLTPEAKCCGIVLYQWDINVDHNDHIQDGFYRGYKPYRIPIRSVDFSKIRKYKNANIY